VINQDAKRTTGHPGVTEPTDWSPDAHAFWAPWCSADLISLSITLLQILKDQVVLQTTILIHSSINFAHEK
jgi:hypothetical protein